MDRAAELAEIEQFIASRGVTTVPPACAAPVTSFLRTAEESRRSSYLVLKPQPNRQQAMAAFRAGLFRPRRAAR